MIQQKKEISLSLSSLNSPPFQPHSIHSDQHLTTSVVLVNKAEIRILYVCDWLDYLLLLLLLLLLLILVIPTLYLRDHRPTGAPGQISA